MKNSICLLVMAFLALGTYAQSEKEAIGAVLDNVHRYASEANFDAYFDQYTEDGVFLGTDFNERWTIEEFKQYARPSFDRGSGWTYSMTERHVFVSEDGKTAWFDENLHNDGFGQCRGTGALVKVDGKWKVSQYNLTVPVPNALLREVVGMIREQETDQ